MKILDLDSYCWQVLPPVLIDDTWGLGLLPKDHIRGIKFKLGNFLQPVPKRQECYWRGPSLQRCDRFRELENTLVAFTKPLYGLCKRGERGGMVLITLDVFDHWLKDPDHYLSTECFDGLKGLFSLLGILQEEGLRVLVLPTGKHGHSKWTLRALNGRVPTFEYWWEVVKTVMGSFQGLDKEEDVVLSKTDHEWYRMLGTEDGTEDSSTLARSNCTICSMIGDAGRV
jgi:hypothetical protein